MNVVVYRLPRRMSLSRPASRCPQCEHPIRWHDNVPVVGWLMLRGRCRDCGSPISPRYPTVEALVALVGGLLAWRAPLLVVIQPTGSDDGLYALDVSWIAFHLLLACVLICVALIEFDGFPPPRRLILLPLTMGLAMLVAWPHLASSPFTGSFNGTPLGGLAAGLLGILTALLIGLGPWFSMLLSAQRSRFAYATGALGELALVGACLGDYRIVSIGLATMVLYVASQWLAQKWRAAGRFGWAGPLALVTLVSVLAGPGSGGLHLPLPQSYPVRVMVAASLMTFLAIMLQVLPRQQPTNTA
jgi:prepilin signal peptidase PulO-like enzyme (type II secretory pathway)